MSLRIGSRVKRAAIAALASSAAVASSLAVAAPAQAASCVRWDLSTVSFSVCIARASSTSAKATVTVNSGTSYISGKLTIAAPNGSSSSCSGRFSPGESCSWTKVGGSGTYYSAWNTASGNTYEGGSVHVS
jgi:hypothetical protein